MSTLSREFAPEFLARAIDQAELEVRKRSIARIPIYFVLLLATIWVTPLTGRFPGATWAFASAIFLLSLGRMYLAIEWKRFLPERKRLWRTLSLGGLHATALLWGLFCGFVIHDYELGWVSFCVLLVTCSICAGEASALAPRFPVLAVYLAMMLVPSLLANLVFVRGLDGFALGVFFLGFLGFLLLQGKAQFTEYWQRLSENAQLSTMLDAMPGTVSWISSELTYLGVNRRQADTWGLRPEDFVGKKVGEAEGALALADFARSLFRSQRARLASEIDLVIRDEPRRFQLFAEKYNHGTEAVLLGIDVTEQAQSAATVVVERAQRLFSARMTNLGQAAARASDALERSLDDPARARRIVRVLGMLAGEERPNEVFAASEAATGAALLFEGARGAALEVRLADGPRLSGRRARIIEVLVILLSNAFDAVEEAGPSGKVTLELSARDGRVEYAVTDSGNGILEELREKIFEPLFTTKGADKGTGIGLHVAREILADHGGTLTLDSSAPGTRFVVSLPALKG